MTAAAAAMPARGPVGRWLIAPALIPVIAGTLTQMLAGEPDGHWAEHLGSAGLKSAMLVVLIAMATMFGWQRFSRLLLAALAVACLGVAFQVIGDHQVARSIWRTSGDPGFGDGYAEGHELSGLGDLLVIMGGLAFAITAGVGHRVRRGRAWVAAGMAIIPPPFLWPATGILMLLVNGLRTGTRLTRISSPNDRRNGGV